jgi:hypothetical protein
MYNTIKKCNFLIHQEQLDHKDSSLKIKLKLSFLSFRRRLHNYFFIQI